MLILAGGVTTDTYPIAEVTTLRSHFPRALTAALVLFTGQQLSAQGTPRDPASQIPAGAPVDTSTSGAGHSHTAPDMQQLNPALVCTGDQFTRFIDAGKELAQKGRKPSQVRDKYGKSPVWYRGGHGKAGGRVWCTDFDGGYVVNESYQAERKYEKVSFPESAASTGLYVKELQFDVALLSAPKIGKNAWAALFAGLADIADPSNGGANLASVPDVVLKQADADEVTAVKFVLSDDEGNNFAAESEGDVSSGTVTHEGVSAVGSFGSVTTTANGTASAVGSHGYASATASGYSRSTYRTTQFIPYTSQHKYFQSRYRVTFPLFDENGNPRISRSVKRLTLRIITEAGELDVDYKLSGPKEERF